jgi:hypothetical protein
VECSTVSASGGGFVVDGGGSEVIRAPRRRGPIRTGALGRLDLCTITLRRSHELVAAAPITADGRTYLDELQTVEGLLLPFALDESTTPPPMAQVLERGRGYVVALDGPDGTPPRGKVGYWTDGIRAVTAALTRAGRRLFFDTERDVVRTNVLGYLTAD